MEDAGRRSLRLLLITHHRRFKVHFRAWPWARALARRGHRVDVLCHADTERWRTRVEQVEGFRLVENPDLLVGALRQGWDLSCAWRRYRFLAREGRPYDLIHCLDTRPAVIWPALAYARPRGIPVVSDWVDWWGRGGLIRERRPGWYRLAFGGVETWFEEHYRARLAGVTTISRALLERAIGLGCRRDRAAVVPGGADLDLFRAIPERGACREQLGLPRDAPVVCFSGLDVLIDLPLAVRAWEHVRRRLPGCVLLLVGPRPGQVRPLMSDPGLMAHVHATGPVPHAALPRHLAAADVFLMPYANKISNVGRWPNKIGDYMAAGRPTVSNPVGEVKQLFERYRVGLLAEASPTAMGEAALDLLRNSSYADSIGAEARRTAETVFAWDVLIVRLEAFYQTILRTCG